MYYDFSVSLGHRDYIDYLKMFSVQKIFVKNKLRTRNKYCSYYIKLHYSAVWLTYRGA